MGHRKTQRRHYFIIDLWPKIATKRKLLISLFRLFASKSFDVAVFAFASACLVQEVAGCLVCKVILSVYPQPIDAVHLFLLHDSNERAVCYSRIHTDTHRTPHTHCIIGYYIASTTRATVSLFCLLLPALGVLYVCAHECIELWLERCLLHWILYFSHSVFGTIQVLV